MKKITEGNIKDYMRLVHKKSQREGFNDFVTFVTRKWDDGGTVYHSNLYGVIFGRPQRYLKCQIWASVVYGDEFLNERKYQQLRSSKITC
jgi:hypothetical protein